MTAHAYRRFIILSGPRTGSHMLAQGLHSHPNVVCFREVFNGRLDFIQYGVEGYDDFSDADQAIRKRDPVGFLQARVFRDWPEEVRAVGFKFHYTHHWGFEGLLDHLSGDRDLHVVHLQRRNALRSLVSLKMAERTGAWLEDNRPKVTASNAVRALRYPAKAARRLSRALRRAPAAVLPAKPRVRIERDELVEHILSDAMRRENHLALYRDHPIFEVRYEDLVAKRDTTFAEVFRFLGVPPARVAISLRQQNPEPLRDLIENYDELRASFEGTPEAALFDD